MMSVYIPKVKVPRSKYPPMPDPREGGIRARMLSVIPDLVPFICAPHFLPPFAPQFSEWVLNEDVDAIDGKVVWAGRYIWLWRHAYFARLEMIRMLRLCSRGFAYHTRPYFVMDLWFTDPIKLTSEYQPPMHTNPNPVARQVDMLYRHILWLVRHAESFDNGYWGWGGCSAAPAREDFVGRLLWAARKPLKTLRICIRFMDLYFYQQAQHFNSLVELMIDYSSVPGVTSMAHGTPAPLHLPNLQYLAVSANDRWISPLQLIQFWNLPKLIHFIYITSNCIEFHLQIALLGFGANLTTLTLAGAYSISTEFLDIKSLCPKLEAYEIEMSPDITLPKSHPTLKLVLGRNNFPELNEIIDMSFITGSSDLFDTHEDEAWGIQKLEILRNCGYRVVGARGNDVVDTFQNWESKALRVLLAFFTIPLPLSLHQMPGGHKQKYSISEEAREARLASKKAYRARNLEEEREKSRIRTRRAADKARQAELKAAEKARKKAHRREKKARYLAAVAAGKSHEEAQRNAQAILSRDDIIAPKADLKAMRSDVWLKVVGTRNQPDWEQYFKERFEHWIAAYEARGWPGCESDILAQINLLQAEQKKIRTISQECLSRFSRLEGKRLQQARDLYEQLRNDNSWIARMEAAEDEFCLWMGSFSMEAYLKEHAKKSLGWQGEL
ncbi:hypothetical protein M422DRAFT_269997 [Sphaerobolus stellatus SS14]|uniref:Uncharacterized protein n=1 Tax=Sphaerobolus stellatus (strain SS14) TaxID=990650 RepID=A0A0C9UTQ3_SPHS4|nr:hypothetical protein M422DRAFT_269997 [Sphaerobolus stellatus SS14]